MSRVENDKKISNVLRRRITGIMLATVFGILWVVQGWPLRIGFVVFMVLCMWEMYGAFSVRGARPVKWAGMIFAVLSMPLYRLYGVPALFAWTAFCCMLGLAGVIFRGEVDLESAFATLFPLIYPGMLVAMLFPLQDLPGTLLSTVAMGLAFLIPSMGDLFAYEIGSKYGRRKLAPALSPKKTVEGAIAGLVASVAVAVLVPYVGTLVTVYIPHYRQYAMELPPLWHFTLLGFVGGVAAQIGDLTASMVKRYCRIKDFGTIFPGHGGMLDRMDSVLFNGVVVYMYFLLIAKL